MEQISNEEIIKKRAQCLQIEVSRMTNLMIFHNVKKFTIFEKNIVL